MDSQLQECRDFHQKQKAGKKVYVREELVRCMSNLPGFLQKLEKHQEKAFNIGVLDWSLLEKWHHDIKEKQKVSVSHSPCISKTSSSFINGSFLVPSKAQSCFPAPQRISHPMHSDSPATGGFSIGSKYAGGDSGYHQGGKTGHDPLKGRQNIYRTKLCATQHIENRLKECRNKNSGLQRVIETRRTRPLESQSTSIFNREKKIQLGDILEGQDKLQVPNYDTTARDCTRRGKPILVVPKTWQEHRYSEISYQSDSSECYGQRLTGTNRTRFLKEPSVEVRPAEVISNFSHCCPRSWEINNSSSQSRGYKSSSPSKVKKLKKKSMAPVSKNLTDEKVSEISNMEMLPKIRNHSGTHQFKFENGGVGWSFHSKESSGTPHIPVKHFRVESSSEVTSAPASGDSVRNMRNAASDSTARPLRRLLDPLLKSKSGISYQFAKSLGRASATNYRALKSSDGRGGNPTACLEKVNFHSKGCEIVDTGDLHQATKNGSSIAQALLQVAVKNGFPLFTFAVESSDDILAATVQKLSSSRANMNSWIYTFFSVNEMKKSTKWMIERGKDRNHGSMPTIIAQMKVSHTVSDLTRRQRSTTKSSIREFVLSSTGTRNIDGQTSDSSPGEEHAAIVVKFADNANRRQNQSDKPLDEVGRLKAPSECHFSMVVILPCGDHGLPCKGEPSSLIDRWKSGGSCDCGGWDLGCRIKTLNDHNGSVGNANSTKPGLASGQFTLFCQEEMLLDEPVFCLSPFKDQIFSVEFDSSLKLIQAFAISIAILDCRKAVAVTEIDDSLSPKMSNEVLSPHYEVTKLSVTAQNDSYPPPLSPIGRF